MRKSQAVEVHMTDWEKRQLATLWSERTERSDDRDLWRAIGRIAFTALGLVAICFVATILIAAAIGGGTVELWP